MKKIIEEKIKVFFEKLEINIEELIISNEDGYIYNIKLKTSDSGIVIGPHGKNIDCIQSILRMMASKIIEQKVSIHLEVNDYMKTKDERLFSFIESKINYAENTNKDIKLPFLNSYERKKVHSFVSNLNKDHISTKSKGDGNERRLFICINGKKPENTNKLTIDIDGDDI